eukprot:m.1134224 g.1134224  ORF g.1134224 m.1134224 type:complete len:143 (+) comp24427_c1_seq57:17-445(+)
MKLPTLHAHVHYGILPRLHLHSKEQMQGFFADGYVHLKGVIPTALVHRALQHINACFGRGMVDRSVPMLTGLPPAEASSPHIMDLFLDPTSALSTAYVTKEPVGISSSLCGVDVCSVLLCVSNCRTCLARQACVVHVWCMHR